MTTNARVQSVHGHELRQLLDEAGRPRFGGELGRLVVERFSDGVVFHDCCQQNLGLAEVLELLAARKKITLNDERYSADVGHDCGGHGHGNHHDHAHHD
jgi:probable metal-binding protein